MNTCTINDKAKNGANVQTVVELLWEDDQPFTKKPFRVRCMVDWTPLFMSHHETNAAAKKEAAKMHNCYLKVHAALVLALLLLSGCASFDLEPRKEERAARQRWALEHGQPFPR